MLDHTYEDRINAACRVVYDRVKTAQTMTFDIAYESEQDYFRRILRPALDAAGIPSLIASEAALRANLERKMQRLRDADRVIENCEIERDQLKSIVAGLAQGWRDENDTMLEKWMACAIEVCPDETATECLGPEGDCTTTYSDPRCPVHGGHER